MSKIVLFLFIFMGFMTSTSTFAGPGDPIGPRQQGGPGDPGPWGTDEANSHLIQLALVDPGPLPEPLRSEPQDPSERP